MYYFPNESKTPSNQTYIHRNIYNFKNPTYNFLPELKKTYSTNDNPTSIKYPLTPTITITYS